MKSLLDPSFVYTDSQHTDIRKTFHRIRREQRKAEEERKKRQEEAQFKVRQIGEKR